MIFYLSIITIANLLIATGVSWAVGVSFFETFAMTALATVIEILISGLTAAICRLLPAKWVNYEWKCYQVSAKEKSFYEKLKIRKWKDWIPEIGHFTGFRKNKIADPKSEKYLRRFLQEMAYGELGHVVTLFTSFFLLLFFPIYEYWIAIGVPVLIVGLVLNILPTLILRYNSYKLRILLKSLQKKRGREETTA